MINTHQQDSHIISLEIVREEDRGPRLGSRWPNFLERARLAFHNTEEWIREKKGNLNLMAALIAGMAIQLFINPPGGVFQASVGDKFICSTESTVVNFPNATGGNIEVPAGGVCAGQAIMSIIYPHLYGQFMVSNAISFVASFGVCLLFLGEIPLDHCFPTWLLTIAMSISVTSFVLTCIYVASMVTSIPVWMTATTDLNDVVVWIFFALVGVVIASLIIRGTVNYCT